jgi:signal transduction histidine kinase
MALEQVLGAVVPSGLLSAFLEQIPFGVAVFDEHGAPVLHNTAFTQIVGVLPALVQQVPLQCDPVTRALAGEEVLGEETDLRGAGPDGPSRRVRASVLRLPRSGVLLLVPAERTVDIREILGVVAHDLRNPLAAMRMTAQLLGKPDEMADERRVTLARRLLTSSNRMEAIVRTLLEYARASAGAVVRLQRETMDLGELTRRVVEEQEVAYPGRRPETRVLGDPVGNWDPGRLEQVIAHLVTNALRHGAESPPPTVTVDGTGADQVTVTVTNGGPPIPAEVMDQLFRPFAMPARAPGTPRRQIGLGLFVVHELVTAHDGTVAGTSDQAGTRFEVALPRAPVTPA